MAKAALNPKQMDFLARYMKPESPTYGKAQESAIAAGYAPGYAKNIVQQAPWFVNIRETNEIVTVDEIIHGIKAETKAEHPKDRLKAWELLGKTKKLFVDRTEATVEVHNIDSALD